MSDHVWGYWDCPYCDTKGIRGDNKSCPNCGAPVLPGTKFYLKNDVREYVEESQKNTQANWICEYCDSQNDARDEFCRNCGSPREEAHRDYFSALPPEAAAPPVPPKKKKTGKAVKRLKKLGIVLALIAFIVWLFMPITRTAAVAGFEWERSIAVEEYKNVDESDWTLPSNANLHYSKEEVHHYNQVLDHYETKTRKVAKKVQDGYETKHKDLGNGQFEEEKVPRYKTVYENETYKEPVYRNVPVYKTKYYYDIDKWVEISSVPTSGKDQKPFWGETGLPDNVPSPQLGDRREGARTQKYYAIIKDKKGEEKKIEYSQNEWSSLKLGDTIKYKTFRFSDKPLQ